MSAVPVAALHKWGQNTFIANIDRHVHRSCASCTRGVNTSLYVIQRGNNRDPCFYSNDDYVRYLQDLHDAAVKNHAVITKV